MPLRDATQLQKAVDLESSAGPQQQIDMSNKAFIFTNGKIFQSISKGTTKIATFHTSLLIKDGIIQHVGSDDDEPIKAAKAASVLTRDLNGQTVLPGFIDGHIHLLILGQSLQKVGLEACTSLADIRTTIQSYAAANPSVPRIFCRGWMHSMTPSGATARMLDDLDPRPIYIDTKDLHSTWCNTAALTELGVATQPDPPGGTIHRDATGAPTGLLSEAAVFTIVWPHIATVASVPERAASMRAAIETYSAAGYTGVIDMAMDDNAWEALLHLRRETPDLPMDIAAYWLIKPSPDDAEAVAQVERVVELQRQTRGRDCRVVGIKVICDGIVDACTAALTEPYSTAASPEPIWSAGQLEPVVRRATEAGLQVALHAIGDATVKMAVDVIETYGKAELRPRIEHLELASAEDAGRLGRLGITASIQPVHSDPAILRAWNRLLGEKRALRAFPYREFADGGAVLAVGTDAPTAPHAPFGNMFVATTRRSAREPKSQGQTDVKLALGLCEAVAGVTEGSAYSCFADSWSGSLTAGKRADFVVVGMEWDPEQLLQARVAETWFGGRKVFG